ncbi:MAG: PDZ domain-containing protein [Bdellovibrionaceae bacterium]|nr:PDZ domain-containing protein [Pseudobdellovibrionaceae bacterium]
MKLPYVSALLEKIKGGDRPPLEKYYPLFFVILLGFFVADLGDLYVRKYLLPTSIPPKKAAAIKLGQSKRYQFPEIISKNIFNSDGVIPQTLAEKEGEGAGEDGIPKLSDLPLDLLGTLVLADPSKSIATISIKGQNNVDPYSVGETVSGMADIKEIQRERVIFRNLRNQALEYIEVPQDQVLALTTERGATVTLPKQSAEKTEFTFQRKDIDAQLENLPNLLQQARVVPETGPDGLVRGYKLVEIQPGSIYEKLGLRLGDVITGVNGESINSPQKALELYQALKSSNDIKLAIDRGGRNVDLSYRLQ